MIHMVTWSLWHHHDHHDDEHQGGGQPWHHNNRDHRRLGCLWTESPLRTPACSLPLHIQHQVCLFLCTHWVVTTQWLLTEYYSGSPTVMYSSFSVSLCLTKNKSWWCHSYLHQVLLVILVNRFYLPHWFLFSGIILFYVLPFMRWPLLVAKIFGQKVFFKVSFSLLW